jgi:hypothetical protein
MQTETHRPAYIRLPPSDERCPHTGLSSTALDGVTRPQARNNYKPPVKSKLMRQKGDRLIRLIDFQSLLDYLDSLPDGSDPENTVPSNANKKEEVSASSEQQEKRFTRLSRAKEDAK